MSQLFLIVTASAVAVCLLGHWPIYSILKKVSNSAFIKYCFRPAWWLGVLIVYRWLLPITDGGQHSGAVAKIWSTFFIAAAAWLLIKSTHLFDSYILGKFDVTAVDNLKARKIRTQLAVLRRIATVIILTVAVGVILMNFDKVRQLGGAILASAGIIGLVVGVAAQKTIGTFIAGIQIAFTQPIRIDDVVIVENEWGRIEEITLTYVVVRIWDQRRLIVPITYFIEQPFQNWTRSTADILATVYLYCDHSVPIEKIRGRLAKILESSELWDKKVCVLQVTNTTEKCIELRALLSASDASKAWSLKCFVREKLVEYMQNEFPDSLPKIRATLEKPAESKTQLNNE